MNWTTTDHSKGRENFWYDPGESRGNDPTCFKCWKKRIVNSDFYIRWAHLSAMKSKWRHSHMEAGKKFVASRYVKKKKWKTVFETSSIHTHTIKRLSGYQEGKKKILRVKLWVTARLSHSSWVKWKVFYYLAWFSMCIVKIFNII